MRKLTSRIMPETLRFTKLLELKKLVKENNELLDVTDRNGETSSEWTGGQHVSSRSKDQQMSEV